MRLVKLKIAGFKSFVDPTTVTFPSSLTGVVGPNGCGKSNIIDAVRWVMGEISAKHLRGDSMADVIFNGSSSRKPLGNASVELVFENSEGKIGGQYANYTEVALRRSVSRDGTSDYYINGIKVRRKDITQLFLGTGLGSRSYAIIEQGMISRVIEAKPEDLRAFLEEAAGISRYKERRRETESRISHTRENLERLNDVREEVEKQIRHLQRQAATARRYQTLKEEERRLHAELLVLRMRGLDTEAAAADESVRACETALQAVLADLREVEAHIEHIRAEQSSRSDSLNLIQGRYYEAGAQVTRIEQNITHTRELRERRQAELTQSEEQLAELGEVERRDRVQLVELAAELAQLAPRSDAVHALETSTAAERDAAEQSLAQWQHAWDEHSAALAGAQRETQVERARIEQLETQERRLLAQRERIDAELELLRGVRPESGIEALTARESEARESGRRSEEELQSLLGMLSASREQERARAAALNALRTRWQECKGTMVSLEALQQAALGQVSGKVTQWLAAQSLDARPRLAQQLRVARGWEKAVETVLGSYLQAVCVDGLDSVAAVLDSFDGGQLALVVTGEQAAPASAESLLSKVSGATALHAMMGQVHTADSLQAALALRPRLQAGESVVTRDGIWLGRDWLRLSRDKDPAAGVIEREETLRTTRLEVTRLGEEIQQLERAVEQDRSTVHELEDRREQLQQQVNRLHREHVDQRARLEAAQNRAREATRRLEELTAQHTDLVEETRTTDEQLRASRAQMQSSIDSLASLEPKRQELETVRDRLREGLNAARTAAQAAQAQARELAVQFESRRSSHASLTTTLTRIEQQIQSGQQRRDDLATQLAEGEEPLQRLQLELEEALQQRLAVESELRAARIALEESDQQLRERESVRAGTENRLEQTRGEMENARLAAQQVRVRREGLAEQFTATRFEFETVLAQLAPEAEVPGWESQLAETTGKIERLGQVNLAAIDEFKEQSERKEYLDRQLKDLTDALEMLESAMRKIDRETRTRFQDTFDRVNAGLKEKFPRLFGGGHAYLEMVGEDSLAAGVSIMARPPGKRNATISQLSGGEKALTAVALVFSIFDLNPAPFCLLDEVDAPLDENNVGRFCDIVREMSRSVQFIFITHNKSTMELASQLVGVTMNEPGVSRLVAVDVDEAVRMAAS
ncbi:MAG: chromosome segregation protein SMC [Steroidobacteraceae bacterium]